MKGYIELKSIAERAPTGPWVAENDSLFFKEDGYTRHLLDSDAGHDVSENNYYAALKFIAAANPSAVLELIAEIEVLRKDRTDWQEECLKRGFEYVRESDDHYVLADVPEMAELLGMLLGVEVRSKDNDRYGETVSMLQDLADDNSDAFHRAYELEKENESLKKDAARYRWLRDDSIDPGAVIDKKIGHSYVEGYPILEYRAGKELDDAIDAAMIEVNNK